MIALHPSIFAFPLRPPCRGRARIMGPSAIPKIVRANASVALPERRSAPSSLAHLQIGLARVVHRISAARCSRPSMIAIVTHS